MIAPLVSLRGRDFIDVADLAPSDLRRVLDLASVINALTDRSHPCQALADLLTLEEVRGELARQRVVYIGDGNNMANSLIEASSVGGFALTIVTPPGYDPDPAIVQRARGVNSGKNHVTLTNQIDVRGATAIYTDVWASMGQEDERATRHNVFGPYQVNARVMDQAPEAVFMHCLPAHRGEEVTDEVIDCPRSVVFQQAENRLYAQMALLAELFGE